QDFLINNLPVNKAAPGTLHHDAFLQDHSNCNPKDGIFLQLTEFVEDPRIIKTHLPFSLLSPSLLETCKVIYVARDPRDVVVSYCHFARLLNILDFVGSMSDFVEHFIDNTLLYGPFWTHLKEAWYKRNHTNILYCFYEDMKANPKAEILRIQRFLNVNLTESQINGIVHYTSFQEMSKRKYKWDKGSDILDINPKILNKDGGFFRKVLSPSVSYFNPLMSVFDDSEVEHGLDNLFTLESLGIKNIDEDMAKADILQVSEFNDNIVYKDKHYYVKLPWKENVDKVPSNFNVARKSKDISISEALSKSYRGLETKKKVCCLIKMCSK
ncbi:Sulfotransferase 1C4, partial [Armadillidium nasatum]